MSENDEFEPEVINPNLTQDDVLSLSAVYGLTLNKRQKETAMKNDKLNQKYAGGSTPDLRLLQNQSSTHTTPARSIHSTGNDFSKGTILSIFVISTLWITLWFLGKTWAES